MMHEEWGDVRRTAEIRVQLTEAPDLVVYRPGTAATGGVGWPVYYRPYAVEVWVTWPNNKIGNGHSIVHIFVNEVQWTGELDPLKVSLLLSDLGKTVPQWLADLVTAAEGKCFG